MNRYFLGATLILYASQSFCAVSSQGEQFVESLNKKNMVLKSKNHTITLQANCKAASKKYGFGNWEQANGGFLITFKSKTLAFPYQELNAFPNSKCGL